MSLHYAIFIIMRTPEFTLDKGITLSLHYCQATRLPTNLPAPPLTAQPLRASCLKIGRFRSKPDTQLRVSPCFGSRTRSARPFPNPRIFPVRGNQLHPRVQQRSTFPRLPPQERQNYVTSPRPASIAAAQTGILPRQFSISPEGIGNVGIPSGCQSVYRHRQGGRAIARRRSRCRYGRLRFPLFAKSGNFFRNR